jgi:hypothetical protein
MCVAHEYDDEGIGRLISDCFERWHESNSEMRRGHRQGSGEGDAAPREIVFTLDMTLRLGPKMRWTKAGQSWTKLSCQTKL